MKKYTQSDAASLRRKAEELLAKKVQKQGSHLTEEEIKKLIFEFQVHQIELELQNEELNLAKDRAEDDAKKYAELYDFAPSGYFTLSREDIILDLNLAGAKMLGKSKPQLKNSRFLFYVADNSKTPFQFFLEKVFGSAGKESCELPLLNGGNSPIIAIIEAIASKDCSQCLLTATDITERKKAEQDVEELSAFNNGIINSAQEGIVVYDRNMEYLVWNPFMENLTGMPASAVLGKHPSVLFPFLKDAGIIGFIDKALNGETNQSIDFFFEIPSTGKSGWASNIASPLRNAQGEITGAINTVLDITKRKQAEMALEEAYMFNKEVIDSAHEGIVVYGRDLKTHLWNPFMENLTGIPASGVLGKHPSEVFPFLNDAGVIDSIKKALNGETSPAIDFFFEIPATGKSGWVSKITAPLKDIKGEIIGVISTVLNITVRKQAEERLKKSEKTLAEAERIGKTGSWNYDVATDTANWSENMFRLFDVDPEMPTELVFTHFVENIVHPDDRGHVVSVFQGALTGKQPYDLEYRTIKHDGSYVDIHAVAETYFDNNGKAVHMTGMLKDLTESK